MLNNKILILYSGKDFTNNRLVNIAMSKYNKFKLTYKYPLSISSCNIDKINIIKKLDNLNNSNNLPSIYVYHSLAKTKNDIQKKYNNINIIDYSENKCDKLNKDNNTYYTLFDYVLDNVKKQSKELSLFFCEYYPYNNKSKILEKTVHECNLDASKLYSDGYYIYHIDEYSSILLFKTRKDCYSFYVKDCEKNIACFKEKINHYNNKIMSLIDEFLIES